MAHVIKTVMTYQLDGATRDFNIPFEYLARKFVVVTLIGVDRKVLTLNTDYRFATKTTITTLQAWGQAQGYTQIEIRRYTSATERLVDFTDGSILRAYDLNISQIQTMHVAEEARDLTADTIGVNNEGHLDARGRRIVNVANAVDVRDAVPLGQLQEMNTGAWQARNQAEAFKDQAKGFRDEAEVSRNAAEAAKARAGASELKAKDWAVKMDGPVEGDQWSAKRYSELASVDRANATVSANNAAASQQAAAASQAAASASEGNALTQANRATSEADRAKTEADKLANNNALAATIDVVNGNNVHWKAQHFFKHGIRSVMVENTSNMVEWNGYNDGGRIATEIVANENGNRRTVMANVPSTNTTSFGGVTHLVGFTFCGADSSHVVTGNGWHGAGAFVEQYANRSAPFVKSLGTKATNTTSVYWPIVKGLIETEGHGYGAAWSFGMLTSGRGEFPIGCIHFMGDNQNYSNLWQFNPLGGEFKSQGSVWAGNAYLATDGNVAGTAWGGDLHSYINNNFQAKGAHARNRGGWVNVWSGSAGGGSVMWLTQDIRFRQCWIVMNGRMIPYFFGDDGAYHMQGWGAGWIHMTLQGGGTQLVNNQDDKSVPTAVWVMA